MVKVTLNKDLVPYAGPMPSAQPDRATPWDLTHNYLLACKLIRAVSVLFHIGRGTAVYSGYIYNRPEGEFKVKLFHRGLEVRTVTLNHLGYGGLLRVEIITRQLEKAVHLDLLTSLRDSGFNGKPVGISAE